MSLSAIERLPVELLQPILLLSDCNISLIQASGHLGARLSHEYVYNATCSHYLTEPMDGHRIAQTAIQTYIFASKWMTWTFFKSWILRHYAPIGCLCGAAEKGKCFDAQWPPDFENATSMVFSRSHLPHLAFFKARLPKKLLRGPWTTDKVQFLQFLLWTTSMTVDWNDVETREIAIKGRLQAMRDRNLDAVVLFNHNRRLGKGADLAILRFAVIHCDCDRSIVYDTLMTGKLWNRITSDDDFAELGEWCQQRISIGDPKGQWLKTKLMEAALPDRPGQGSDGVRDRRKPAALRLNREAGDYDGGPQDQLIVKNHRWYQPIRQFGWWYQEAQSQKVGLHNLQRGDLGDYWNYFHGSHHVIKGVGTYVYGWPMARVEMWLEMWIPDQDCQGVGECTCVEYD